MDNLKKIGWFFGYWAAIVVGLAAITSLTRFVANGFSASPFGLSGSAGTAFLIEGLLGALFLICKPTFVRVLLVILMLLILWAAVGKPNAVEAAEATAPCVPFAAISVPDETDPMWKPNTTFRMFDFVTRNQIGWKRYYETSSGLTLGIYEYFGQVAFKAWACKNAEVDPKTGDTKDHMTAIPDGKGGWHVRNIQSPREFDILAHNGIMTGVSIVLQQKPEVGAPTYVIMRPENNPYR